MYSSYDFTESLDRAGIDIKDVAIVLYAWGDSPEGWGSWDGGFIMYMKSGNYAKIEGWCDTSGWGCQDNAEVAYTTDLPEAPAHADYHPADLNLALKR